MPHRGLLHLALAKLHVNPQFQLQEVCGLLRRHRLSAPLLSHLPQNIATRKRNHLYRYIPGPKPNWHTKPGGPHPAHHRGHLISQVSRPRPAIVWHLFQEFQSPKELHHLDLHQHYSSSVNINSFRRPYRRQRKVCAPILFLVRLVFLVDRAQLIAVARRVSLLLLKLFCHAQVQELNRQVIFRCQCQLELISDVDLKAHLLLPRPFQSGPREVAHQLPQLQHPGLCASFQSFANH